MQNFRDQLCGLLNQVENELRRLDLWTTGRPPAQALHSTLPFSVDTLSFSQWLQWICLPQLRQLLALGATLPDACAIAPMAELTYRDSSLDTERLLRLLTAVDRVVTSHPGRHH